MAAASSVRAARPELAEFAGTFLLVSVGAGAAALGFPWAALVPGVVVGGCVYAFGRVSGAHFNPAVTLGFAAAGEFPWRRGASYVMIQLAAALVGAALLFLAAGSRASASLTIPRTDLATGFVAEVVVTFVLMTVIMGAATDRRFPTWCSGLAIGGAVTLGVFLAGPLTGGSMNPARTLGPAVVLGAFDSFWLYLVAPAVGALIASMAYGRIRGASERRAGARGEVA